MAALAGSVSRRYARALFSLGCDNGQFEAYGRELGLLAEVFAGSEELRNAMANPVVKDSEKRAILDGILGALLPPVGASSEVRRFVRLLLERRRIIELPRVASAYQRLTDERLGRVRGRVVSATPLDSAALDEIRAALEARTGKQVLLETSVDPEILGGVVAHVGDLVLDGSLRSRLETLSRKILN
ncbi:MAG: ATP synthase F1 subunit delta [Myxococcales bacterium]|nr:ATP synthase F1 subunit delta [Myxococcales bacterium]